MLKNLFIFLLCFTFLVAYTPLEEIEEEVLATIEGRASVWAQEAMTKLVKRPILSTKDGNILFKNAKTVEFDPLVVGRSKDLRPFDNGIRDQGSRGWCTSFATIAAMENLLKQAGIIRVLSEKDLWNQYRAYDMYKSAAAAQLRGARLEEYVPYYGWNKRGWRNSQITRVTHRENLRFVSQIFERIDRNQPVLAAVDVTNHWGNPRLGIIPTTGRINGAHAVTIVGYSLGRVNFFVFKNSWGKGWGDRGYGYLPIDYCNERFRCYFISINSVI